MEDELIEVILLRTIHDDGDSNRKRIIHLRRRDPHAELGFLTGRGFVVLLNNAQEGVDYSIVSN